MYNDFRRTDSDNLEVDLDSCFQRRYWCGSRSTRNADVDVELSDANRTQHEELPHNAKAGIRVRRLRKVRHCFRFSRSSCVRIMSSLPVSAFFACVMCVILSKLTFITSACTFVYFRSAYATTYMYYRRCLIHVHLIRWWLSMTLTSTCLKVKSRRC